MALSHIGEPLVALAPSLVSTHKLPRSLILQRLATSTFGWCVWSRSFSVNMAPGTAEKKIERSYLSSAVDSFNPWAASRSTTPTQKTKPEEETSTVPTSANPDDHTTTHLYGQSLRTYPSGCPPLKVQWFHAVDVPKRKPRLSKSTQPEKPSTLPKKYNPFSSSDSKALEAEYQKLLEELEEARIRAPGDVQMAPRKRKADVADDTTDGLTNRERGLSDPQSAGVRVPVNEDFLFDVDIECRELAPVYWLGPVYDGMQL